MKLNYFSIKNKQLNSKINYNAQKKKYWLLCIVFVLFCFELFSGNNAIFMRRILRVLRFPFNVYKYLSIRSYFIFYLFIFFYFFLPLLNNWANDEMYLCIFMLSHFLVYISCVVILFQFFRSHNFFCEYCWLCLNKIESISNNLCCKIELKRLQTSFN